MTDRETIVRRIQKLLALAKSPEQAEAETAAVRAQELLQKYKLEMKDVEEAKKGDVEIDMQWYARKVVYWKRDLAFAVARGFFCRCVHTPPSPESDNKAWLNFVGKREDLEVAKEVFNWLMRELLRLASGGWRRAHRKGSVNVVSWKQSFLNGAVYVLDQRLREGAEQFAVKNNDCREIQRVADQKIDEFLKETFQKLEPSPVGETIGNYHAWVAGQEAGAKIEIRPTKTKGELT